MSERPSTSYYHYYTLLKKGCLLSFTESNDCFSYRTVTFELDAIIHFLKLFVMENVNLAKSRIIINFATFLDVQWRRRTEAEWTSPSALAASRVMKSWKRNSLRKLWNLTWYLWKDIGKCCTEMNPLAVQNKKLLQRYSSRHCVLTYQHFLLTSCSSYWFGSTGNCSLETVIKNRWWINYSLGVMGHSFLVNSAFSLAWLTFLVSVQMPKKVTFCQILSLRKVSITLLI